MALVVGTNSYVNSSDTNAYFADLLHDGTVWTDAVTAGTSDSALVTAAQMLDRQVWAGAKTSAAQALEWPRTGVTDEYGTAIASDSVPTRIIEAQQELALALLQDLSVQTSGSAARDKKAVTAEGVTVEWFGSGASSTARFPTIIQELCGVFLYSAQSGGIPTAYGTDNESAFDEADEQFELSSPYG